MAKKDKKEQKKGFGPNNNRNIDPMTQQNEESNDRNEPNPNEPQWSQFPDTEWTIDWHINGDRQPMELVVGSEYITDKDRQQIQVSLRNIQEITLWNGDEGFQDAESPNNVCLSILQYNGTELDTFDLEMRSMEDRAGIWNDIIRKMEIVRVFLSAESGIPEDIVLENAKETLQIKFQYYPEEDTVMSQEPVEVTMTATMKSQDQYSCKRCEGKDEHIRLLEEQMKEAKRMIVGLRNKEEGFHKTLVYMKTLRQREEVYLQEIANQEKAINAFAAAVIHTEMQRQHWNALKSELQAVEDHETHPGVNTVIEIAESNMIDNEWGLKEKELNMELQRLLQENRNLRSELGAINLRIERIWKHVPPPQHGDESNELNESKKILAPNQSKQINIENVLMESRNSLHYLEHRISQKEAQIELSNNENRDDQRASIVSERNLTESIKSQLTMLQNEMEIMINKKNDETLLLRKSVQDLEQKLSHKNREMEKLQEIIKEKEQVTKEAEKELDIEGHEEWDIAASRKSIKTDHRRSTEIGIWKLNRVESIEPLPVATELNVKLTDDIRLQQEREREMEYQDAVKAVHRLSSGIVSMGQEMERMERQWSMQSDHRRSKFSEPMDTVNKLTGNIGIICKETENDLDTMESLREEIAGKKLVVTRGMNKEAVEEDKSVPPAHERRFDSMDNEKMNQRTKVEASELKRELKRITDAHNERGQLLTKTTAELKLERNKAVALKKKLLNLKAKLSNAGIEHRAVVEEKESEINRVNAALKKSNDRFQRQSARSQKKPTNSKKRKLAAKKAAESQSARNEIIAQRVELEKVKVALNQKVEALKALKQKLMEIDKKEGEIRLLNIWIARAKREQIATKAEARNKVKMEKVSKAKIAKLVAQRNVMRKRLKENEDATKEIVELREALKQQDAVVEKQESEIKQLKLTKKSERRSSTNGIKQKDIELLNKSHELEFMKKTLMEKSVELDVKNRALHDQMVEADRKMEELQEQHGQQLQRLNVAVAEKDEALKALKQETSKREEQFAGYRLSVQEMVLQTILMEDVVTNADNDSGSNDDGRDRRSTFTDSIKKEEKIYLLNIQIGEMEQLHEKQQNMIQHRDQDNKRLREENHNAKELVNRIQQTLTEMTSHLDTVQSDRSITLRDVDKHAAEAQEMTSELESRQEQIDSLSEKVDNRIRRIEMKSLVGRQIITGQQRYRKFGLLLMQNFLYWASCIVGLLIFVAIRHNFEYLIERIFSSQALIGQEHIDSAWTFDLWVIGFGMVSSFLSFVAMAAASRCLNVPLTLDSCNILIGLTLGATENEYEARIFETMEFVGDQGKAHVMECYHFMLASKRAIQMNETLDLNLSMVPSDKIFLPPSRLSFVIKLRPDNECCSILNLGFTPTDEEIQKAALRCADRASNCTVSPSRWDFEEESSCPKTASPFEVVWCSEYLLSRRQQWKGPRYWFKKPELQANAPETQKQLLLQITSSLTQLMHELDPADFGKLFSALRNRYGSEEPKSKSQNTDGPKSQNTTNVHWVNRLDLLSGVMILLTIIVPTLMMIIEVTKHFIFALNILRSAFEKRVIRFEVQRIIDCGAEKTKLRDIRALIKRHYSVLGHISTVGAGKTKIKIFGDIMSAVGL